MRKIGLGVLFLLLGVLVGGNRVKAQVPTSSLPDLYSVNRVSDSKITPGRFSLETIVANEGNGKVVSSSTGYKTSLYLDPAGLPLSIATSETSSSTSFSELGSGQTMSVVFDVDLSPGTHDVYSWVDKNNNVAESDETDNIGRTTFFVRDSCGWCSDRCTRVTTVCALMPPPQGKSCVTENNSCVIKDSSVSPTPQAAKTCTADNDCGNRAYCYQPPMPECRPGMACVQVMPTKICKACTPRPECMDNGQNCRPSLPNGAPPFCPVSISGDANGDGKVDLADFGIWKRDYLIFSSIPLTSFVYPGPWVADFNKDKSIDLGDFGVWKKNYLKITPTLPVY